MDEAEADAEAVAKAFKNMPDDVKELVASNMDKVPKNGQVNYVLKLFLNLFFPYDMKHKIPIYVVHDIVYSDTTGIWKSVTVGNRLINVSLYHIIFIIIKVNWGFRKVSQ